MPAETAMLGLARWRSSETQTALDWALTRSEGGTELPQSLTSE